MGITYEQAFADHSYLWEDYGPAYDMTGGYVDQEDLALLLKKPTKATAKACLIRRINYWFDVGTRDNPNAAINTATDPILREIKDRYT